METVENLPAEIMQIIFLEICSPQTTFPLRGDEPRFLITRVCSRWRAIALSTSALWANLCIHPSLRCQPPYVSTLRAWISRAAQSTLSLDFQTPNTYFDTSPTIADFLFASTHRCSTPVMYRLLMLPPQSLRSLQSLTISAGDRTLVTDPTPSATAFEPCPQLHTFSLTTCPRHNDRHPENLRIANFNVPWHQLTTLRLDSPSIPADECLGIIRRCTALQQCNIGCLPSIDNLTRDRIMKFSYPPTTLPSLRTLCIGFDDWEPGGDYHAFFRALHLPHLRKFQLRDSPNPLPWSLLIFRSVLGDTIQELDLSRLSLPESLPEMLALVPNLEILWLGDDFHEHPEIMHALGEGTIAPRLITLFFDFVQNLQFLLDILEARAAAARADVNITAFIDVTVLHLGDAGINPSDEARLMSLAETGTKTQLG
ncbi:hypothetical protein BD779DRAFT_1547211 [Infundibulicybe gibba]|nr:hypothetical protein BD779DRAFT_1547211 [Infundibulicybe gibba]